MIYCKVTEKGFGDYKPGSNVALTNRGFREAYKRGEVVAWEDQYNTELIKDFHGYEDEEE